MGKYEHIDPRSKLHEGEPYFFLRAQDVLAPAAVEAYAGMLEAAAKIGGTAGADLHRQAEDVRLFADRMRKWQTANWALTKLPD